MLNPRRCSCDTNRARAVMPKQDLRSRREHLPKESCGRVYSLCSVLRGYSPKTRAISSSLLRALLAKHRSAVLADYPRKEPCRVNLRQGFSLCCLAPQSKLRLFLAGLHDQADSEADLAGCPRARHRHSRAKHRRSSAGDVPRSPIELRNAQRKPVRDVDV